MTNTNKYTSNGNVIGERIWKLREERNMTHEELAFKANITPRYVYKIENGGVPSLPVLIAICNALEVNIDSILLSE